MLHLGEGIHARHCRPSTTPLIRQERKLCIAPHSGEELSPTLYGLKLQSEGRDARFRTIWIKHLDIREPQTRSGY